jgi:hypothetical protein
MRGAEETTIPGPGVQKMTLATLKGMNFNMGDVANAFKLKVADSVTGGVQKGEKKARLCRSGSARRLQLSETVRRRPEPGPGVTAADSPTGVVDRSQWWGALTQQFPGAAEAMMKDVAQP